MALWFGRSLSGDSKQRVIHAPQPSRSMRLIPSLRQRPIWGELRVQAKKACNQEPPTSRGTHLAGVGKGEKPTRFPEVFQGFSTEAACNEFREEVTRDCTIGRPHWMHSRTVSAIDQPAWLIAPASDLVLVNRIDKGIDEGIQHVFSHIYQGVLVEVRTDFPGGTGGNPGVESALVVQSAAFFGQ